MVNKPRAGGSKCQAIMCARDLEHMIATIIQLQIFEVGRRFDIMFETGQGRGSSGLTNC